MTDTHCHLFFDELYNNIEQIIEKSVEAGVNYIICPSTDLKTAEKCLAIADKFEMVYASVGIHPHDTSSFCDNDISELEKFLAHKKVVAIGEIGLDYYYDYSPKEIQKKAFKQQLLLAKKYKLPVILHNRLADEDVFDIFTSIEKRPKAQFHCFSSNVEYAGKIIALDSYISFTGNITYPKNEELRNVVKSISVEDILLETDSPFMAPVPFRGKTNSPVNLKLTVEKLAELLKLSTIDIIRTTDANVFKLFGIGNNPDVSFTYQIGHSLYINITNRCNADCIFCDRNGLANISGYNLKMERNAEPPAEVYIKEIGDPKDYDEIVFCGYGEPTIRLEIIKKVGYYVKNNGGKTRLNTNGHGNLINKRNILPELKGIIDTVSISLNSTSSKLYSNLMRLPESYFSEMLEFTKNSKEYIQNVVMSIVNLNEVDIASAQKLTEEIGVEFKIRNYF